ncbi:hypothetical protein [Sphingomonas sp. BE138]|uniref:hypothetical protein n=1 Tax=Sphingomonas sp. BE138 TaxID=2817845 RepID=UPI0038699BEB
MHEVAEQCVEDVRLRDQQIASAAHVARPGGSLLLLQFGHHAVEAGALIGLPLTRSEQHP